MFTWSIDIKIDGKWVEYYIPAGVDRDKTLVIKKILDNNTAVEETRLITWYHQDMIKNELVDLLRDLSKTEIGLAVPEDNPGQQENH